MSAMHPNAATPAGRRPAGTHWAARPLPEPPRTRRVSRSSRVPLDGIQDQLEQWLREQSVSYTFDAD